MMEELDLEGLPVTLVIFLCCPRTDMQTKGTLLPVGSQGPCLSELHSACAQAITPAGSGHLALSMEHMSLLHIQWIRASHMCGPGLNRSSVWNSLRDNVENL